MEKTAAVHNIEPVYDKNSRILILGSFPSVRSREEGFFYAFPQNRFWRVLSRIYGEDVPLTVPQKKAFLLKNRTAVWDVVKSCNIVGSDDTSISDVVPNDIGMILSAADIRTIYTNGTKAYNMYNKYIKPITGREAVKLPSTSPANAAYSLDRLCESWKIITE